jgi:hypothetical protein
MLSPNKTRRHIVQCDWKCKYCHEIFGSENRSHYGTEPPEFIKPTWFFASMTLLDHLRDCQKKDYTAELKAEYGPDFLNHAFIYNWFNIHAMIERHYVSEEELA